MFYKIFTHDYRPPIQGGNPIWDGTFPFTTPTVTLDTTSSDCGTGGGWHFVDSLAEGFRIAGLWPVGWPSVAVVVEPASDAIQRGTKWRASQLTITRAATVVEIDDAVHSLSMVFEPFTKEMAMEQLAWRAALARPLHDEAAVIIGLHEAVTSRKLDWKIQKYATAWDAWDALTVFFAAQQKWIKEMPEHLTIGIRDAYRNGLELAIPTGPNELGYVLAAK